MESRKIKHQGKERYTCASLNKRLKENENEIKVLQEIVRSITKETDNNLYNKRNITRRIEANDTALHIHEQGTSDEWLNDSILKTIRTELKETVLSAVKQGEDEIALEIMDILQASMYETKTRIMEKFKQIQKKLKEKKVYCKTKPFNFDFESNKYKKVNQLLPGFPGVYNLYFNVNLKMRPVPYLPIKIETVDDEIIEKWIAVNIQQENIEGCRENELDKDLRLRLIPNFNDGIDIDVSGIEIVKKSKESIDLYDESEKIARFFFKWSTKFELKRLKLNNETRNFFGFTFKDSAYRCKYLPIQFCNNSELQQVIGTRVINATLTENNMAENVLKIAYKNLIVIAANDFNLVMQVSSRVQVLLKEYGIYSKETSTLNLPVECVTVNKFDIQASNICINKNYIEKLQKMIIEIQETEITNFKLLKLMQKLQIISVGFPILQTSLFAMIEQTRKQKLSEDRSRAWLIQMNEMLEVIAERNFQGREHELNINRD